MGLEFPIGKDGLAQMAKVTEVPKTWGKEAIYWNADGYCMKLLIFDEKAEHQSTSMHFHRIKHETLLVVGGTLRLEFIVEKQRFEVDLHPGQAWVVPPGFVHKLSRHPDSNGDLLLVEASSFDDPTDSYRIES